MFVLEWFAAVPSATSAAPSSVVADWNAVPVLRFLE